MAHTNLDFTAPDRAIIARTSPVRRFMRSIGWMFGLCGVIALLAMPATQAVLKSGLALVKTSADAPARAASSPALQSQTTTHTRTATPTRPQNTNPARSWVVSAVQPAASQSD